MKRAIVLNDYQRVSQSSADWSPLEGRVEVDVVDRHIADSEELVAVLADYEIIVAMRERTPFPRSTLERLDSVDFLMADAHLFCTSCKSSCMTALGILLEMEASTAAGKDASALSRFSVTVASFPLKAAH